MHLDANAHNLPANSAPPVRLDPVPDVCPRCHRNIHPKDLYVAYLDGRKLCQGLFRCTNGDCQESFVATYRHVGTLPNGRMSFALIDVQPMAPRPTAVPEAVAKVSPTFVEISGQVDYADSAKLDQLVGIGLRKAIEFLVKDYAIHTNPSDAEAIQKSMLAPCIDKFIDDGNVKTCAKRAAWLGNDETHYIRKWDDKDIRDLKLLVRLTVNWIENVLLTEQYEKEMAQGKK